MDRSLFHRLKVGKLTAGMDTELAGLIMLLLLIVLGSLR